MSRKRSTSFRGAQNAPAVPAQYKRKSTGLDLSAIQAATQTIKETIKAQIDRYKGDIEVLTSPIRPTRRIWDHSPISSPLEKAFIWIVSFFPIALIVCCRCRGD